MPKSPGDIDFHHGPVELFELLLIIENFLEILLTSRHTQTQEQMQNIPEEYGTMS